MRMKARVEERDDILVCLSMVPILRMNVRAASDLVKQVRLISHCCAWVVPSSLAL